MNQNKRLLMISTDSLIFKEGSAVRERQIKYAKEWGEVHIVVFSDISKKEISIAPNCWVYPTRSVFKILRPFDAIKTARFIASRRGITDITCQDPFDTGIVGVSIKKRVSSSNTPIHMELQVHTDIGSPYFVKSSFLNFFRILFAKYNLPKADHIRVVSNRIKNYLVDELHIDQNIIEVRPIYVDVDRIKNAPITVDLNSKYPQFSKIILMVSRLEPEKNISLAIDSFKLVLNNIPDVGLVIVGSGGCEANLKDLSNRLGISDKVIFEGWVDQNTLPSYYKTADLLLVTSLYEGYGMAMVEANAVGCKIVSTDVGVVREIGASIVGHNSSDMSVKILELLR